MDHRRLHALHLYRAFPRHSCRHHRPWLGAALVVSGIGSALGNQIGGIASDRFGPERTPAVVLTVLARALAGASLVAVTLPPATAIFVIPPIMLVWSAAGWAGHPSQMSRLAAMAPDATVVALSLNASALYLGIAAGATLGQQTIAPSAAPGRSASSARPARSPRSPCLSLALRRKRAARRQRWRSSEISIGGTPVR